MNISPDGVTVRFKTEPEDLFMAEKSGAKPNTVRIIDHYDRQKLKKKLPEKIMIQHKHEIFLRTVTHVYVSEMILGRYLAIFSWTNEKHPPAMRSEIAPEIEADIMSRNGEPQIDEGFVCVTISKNLHRSLEILAHGRSMNSIIQETYEAYLYKQDQEKETVTEEPGGDRSSALIAISKGMMDMLSNIANGRSMDKIIRDLYQLYCDKHGGEPLHD